MTLRRGGMRRFRLPLVRPLATAHGTIESRDGFLVTLMDDEGACGFGEATPLPSFGTEDASTTRQALESALMGLVDGRARSFEESLEISARICREAPCALSAVDGALHDLAAQAAGLPLAGWIRARAGIPGEPKERVAVQALVVGEDPATVAQAARASLAEGFETFKLKLATSPRRRGPDVDGHLNDPFDPDLGLDLERVAALREVIGPGCRIRLDANEAWTARDAARALEAFERFEIDFVEQPVARDDRAALKHLDECGSIPVAADEALLGQGWRTCLESRAASIFVVKPAALGGIEVSLEIFRRARDQGIRVIWSSLIDAAVGRRTAVALAAALDEGLGDRHEVHGLGTAKLLSRDLVEGREVIDGHIASSRGPGLGCELEPVWDAGDSFGEEGCDESWIVEAKA